MPTSFHTFAATTQSHKAWPDNSQPPQKPQLLSEATFLDARQKLVGIMFLHALYRKCLILFGHLSCQTNFHNPADFPLSEHSLPSLAERAFLSTLSATQYVLLTVKSPFFDQAQIRESSGILELSGIPRMMVIVEVWLCCGKKGWT